MASLPEPQELLDLKKKTDKFEKSQVKGLAKKIQDMMMTDGQIAKKIISIKSPKMTDDELNLLVYGKDLKKELGAKYKAWKSEKEKEEEVKKEEESEPKSKKEKRKKEKKLFKPLPKDSPVYDEVKKVKTDIKEKLLMWEEKGKLLKKEITQFGVLVGSTISAAIVIAAPVSFNVPGAITLTLTLLNAFNQLQQRIMDFVPLLKIVDLIRFVLPDDQLNKITGPLMGFVTIVLGISEMINKISNALPKMSDAKKEALVKIQNQIDGLDKEIKNLKPSDFDSTAAYESKKKSLEKRKESLSDKASKLL
jgi:hypothetical protein